MVCPGAPDSARSPAAFSPAGVAGLASRCSAVTEYSPTPLVEAARTGKAVACEPLPSGTTPGPAVSLRYRPEVTAWLSPSSFASATGSIAAMSIGKAQPTVKPGRWAVSP